VTTGRLKRAWLWTLQRTLNPLALRMARRGSAPFSLVRHMGRRSGRSFETPLILARVPGGFVAELTYGPQVNWYRNLAAAGHGTVIWRGREFAIEGIEPMTTDAGRRAFGPPASWLLTLLRRHEFRLLRQAAGAASEPGAASDSTPD
jgi:deazaflavin-dependent oxidoreductase (nitroreductase family)